MTANEAETALLVKRLRDAADELESAGCYGLPVPTSVSVTGYENLEGLNLSLDTTDEFDEWADYASDVTAEEYDHSGAHWRRATASLGFEGLRVTFAVSASRLRPQSTEVLS